MNDILAAVLAEYRAEHPTAGMVEPDKDVLLRWLARRAAADRLRANDAARASAEALDAADDLRREIGRLREHIAVVESDRTAWDQWAHRVAETTGDEARDAVEKMLKHWQSALKLRADELEETRAKLAAARSDVEQLRAALPRAPEPVTRETPDATA